MGFFIKRIVTPAPESVDTIIAALTDMAAELDRHAKNKAAELLDLSTKYAAALDESYKAQTIISALRKITG